MSGIAEILQRVATSSCTIHLENVRNKHVSAISGSFDKTNINGFTVINSSIKYRFATDNSEIFER